MASTLYNDKIYYYYLFSVEQIMHVLDTITWPQITNYIDKIFYTYVIPSDVPMNILPSEQARQVGVLRLDTRQSISGG